MQKQPDLLTLTHFKARPYLLSNVFGKLLIITFSLVFFLTLKTTVHAYILEKNYTRTYEVRDDYVQITENKNIKVVQKNYYIKGGSQEGFTIFNPIQNDPDAQTKLQKTLQSISVKDGNGNNLSYKTETTAGGNLNLDINIDSPLYYNQTFSITLTYRSYGLVIKSGALRDVYIPAFAPNYIFENSQSKETIVTNVLIPKKYGNINFTAPQTQVNSLNDNWVINYPEQQLVGQTAWIEVGTVQDYSFKITQPYSGSTTIPLAYNIYKLVIPGNIQRGPITQKVVFSKISPTPTSIEQDSNGNLFATFKIPATDAGNIEIDGYAQLTQNNNFNLSNSGAISSIPKEIIDNNTKAAPYWESDNPEIIQAAKSIAGSDFNNPQANVYNLVSKTYKFVVDKINYSVVKQFGLNKRQGALATLRGGAAVCMEYSDLFIALMRAEGIPARAAFGTGYSALDYNTSSTNAINHQWAEVYIPNLNSWIEVDTTWGKNGPALIGGDLNHFYSHVASVDPETPSTAEITYFGKDYQFYDREMTVAATDSFPKDGYTTPDQLLQQYPSKGNSNDAINTISSSLNLFFSRISSTIDDYFVKEGLPIILAQLFKITLIAIPIVLILFLIFRGAFKKKLIQPKPT